MVVKNAWIRSCVDPSDFHRECLCGGLSLMWLMTLLVASDSVSLVCVSVRSHRGVVEVLVHEGCTSSVYLFCILQPL